MESKKLEVGNVFLYSSFFNLYSSTSTMDGVEKGEREPAVRKDLIFSCHGILPPAFLAWSSASKLHGEAFQCKTGSSSDVINPSLFLL